MRLKKARIRGYRSIIDTGYFEIEKMKTILVGPNEAGKTAVLQALQKLNPPKGIELFNPLRDYPRSKYDEDIKRGNLNSENFTVVEGIFELSDEEKSNLPEAFRNINYVYGRYLNNNAWHNLDGDIPQLFYKDIENDINRLLIHIDENSEKKAIDSGTAVVKPSAAFPINFTKITSSLNPEQAGQIEKFLKANLKLITEGGKEEERYNKLLQQLSIPLQKHEVLTYCEKNLPKFVLFSNYFKTRPSMNLAQLAERTERNNFDDKQYDYGNNCLLRYLGFTARELSDLAANSQYTPEQEYRDKLDKRSYCLNAASINLTNVIKDIWNPDVKKQEANKLRIFADGQYLKVVVEDDLGVEVELDQRSEGFQWMVSFFVVFFAEAQDKHKNAILLLDEPGMSLHGLKQAEFRKTLSKLSEKNQTIYSTHSPFLVGANELEFVRVVEMVDRKIGTKVHTTVTAGDAAALLPLQEALGYDLAQNLFINERNLVLEGLTDYWYLEGISELLKGSGKTGLNEKIALVPADCASKVVYFATILHAQNLKIAALLDSDSAGDQAATQDTLVNALGNKRILRTKDAYKGTVKKCEIEDILRETLVNIGKTILGWDVTAIANSQPARPIVDIFAEVKGKDFSKYKLAKAFLTWARDNDLTAMTQVEAEQCEALVSKINKALE